MAKYTLILVHGPHDGDTIMHGSLPEVLLVPGPLPKPSLRLISPDIEPKPIPYSEYKRGNWAGPYTHFYIYVPK